MTILPRRIRRLTYGLLILALPPVRVAALTPLNGSRNDLEVVRSVEAFDSAASKRWTLDHSPNTVCTPTFGYQAVGIDTPMFRLDCRQKPDAPAGKKYPRWFALRGTFTASGGWSDVDGLRMVYAAKKPGRWWLCVVLTSGGATYKQVISPDLLTRAAVSEDRLLPFSEFKDKEGKPWPVASIDGIEISGSVPNNTLYIDRVELYRTVRLETWLTFRTGRDACNLYERGESVPLIFTRGGMGDAETSSFRYVIRDFHDTVVREETFTFEPGNQDHTAVFAGPPGFYEVRAFAGGKTEGKRSCIKVSGSMPPGLGTFAIMPSTLAENVERRKRAGTKAFFGFHGHANGLTDYMGVSWNFGGGRWIWKERDARPDRSKGMAEWARKAIAEQAPMPEYEIHHIINFGANHIGATPEWARKTDMSQAPPYANWEDFLNFWRDTIRVNKHLYPHMNPRIYDPAWEVNLNVPKTGIHKPPYHPEDVVELYRRTREVLKEEDRNAILVGPNCSSPIKNLGWNEPLFKAGLLQYIDAYNCHGYHSPPPENARVVEAFRDLRAMIRKYNDGRDLPIYITELGYRAKYGSEDRYREHARWHTHTAIILKGEGIRAYLPFYSYDFPGKDSSWGFCFNLHPKLKWGPKHVAPRPAVPALAVCVRELEGAVPVRSLRFFGSGVWGYSFRSTDAPVLALWHPEFKHTLRLPVGDVASVCVTDIMGASKEAIPGDGVVALEIGPDPVYVHGTSSALYATPPATFAALDGTDVLPILPGETRTVPLLPGAHVRVDSVQVIGDVRVGVAAEEGAVLRVAAPVDFGPDPVPVLVSCRQGGTGPRQLLFWVVPREAVELDSFDLQVSDGTPVAAINIRNRGTRAVKGQAELRVNGSRQPGVEVQLTPAESTSFQIPLGVSGAVDPTHKFDLEFLLTCSHANDIRARKAVNLLAAYRTGAEPATTVPNRVAVRGEGASGRVDDAEMVLHWTAQALLIGVTVHDDVHAQRLSDGTIWQEDSLQFAFDTHPEQNAVYEPLASVFTKKTTEIAVARTPAGVIAWRHKTHNEGELATGDLTSEVSVQVTRDEDTKTTFYRLRIPWAQIGLDAVSTGKPIGISMLVNDRDGKGTKRTGIELFGGIMKSKDHRQFGVFLLK